MAIETNIEWCDSTVNPTTGCEGCELWNGRDIKTCYAGNIHETRLAVSYAKLYDKDFQEVRLAPGRMVQAAAWPSLSGKNRHDKPWLNGRHRHIFVGDMGDFCSRSVPTDYIKEEILGQIASPCGRRHFWLLLTKQIHRLVEISEEVGGLPDNCMAMTSVTDQARADQRIPWLLKVRSKWRGISAEPLLGPVDLSKWLDGCSYYCDHQSTEGGLYGHRPERAKFDWVVVGGESGPNARPMHPDWARSIRDQCQAAGVPFFFKQWGEWEPLTEYKQVLAKEMRALYPDGRTISYEGTESDLLCGACVWTRRVGKKAAGRLLDGREWNEYPRVRG